MGLRMIFESFPCLNGGRGSSGEKHPMSNGPPRGMKGFAAVHKTVVASSLDRCSWGDLAKKTSNTLYPEFANCMMLLSTQILNDNSSIRGYSLAILPLRPPQRIQLT